MRKLQKLLERIRQNPKNVSFKDLSKVLEAYGFELKRTKGIHNSFVGRISGKSILLVIPYNEPLKIVYVKKALEHIDQIGYETEESEDDGTQEH